MNEHLWWTACYAILLVLSMTIIVFAVWTVATILQAVRVHRRLERPYPPTSRHPEA